MGNPPDGGIDLRGLVEAACGADRSDVLAMLVDPFEPGQRWTDVPRVVLAHALDVALFAELLTAVPSGAAYVAEKVAAGGRVLLDHGAVRTVAWPCTGALPPGAEQVARVLEPLGYRRCETYPLPRLRMTGHAYTHLDRPADVAQWFVSELHPDEFSMPFRQAVERVLATSTDALDDGARRALATLAADERLTATRSRELLPSLVACFRRRHEPPTEADYEALLAESAEMAWIATEGTTFNHATDRVVGIEQVAAAERSAGRPIKDRVEVSATGRIRQTAHRATPVVRALRGTEGGFVDRTVPGSFFEFIERAAHPVAADGRPDLGFDTGNAQGIFAMTAPADPAAPVGLPASGDRPTS